MVSEGELVSPVAGSGRTVYCPWLHAYPEGERCVLPCTVKSTKLTLPIMLLAVHLYTPSLSCSCVTSRTVSSDLLPVVTVVATPLILGSPFRVQVMLGTGSPVNPQDKVTLVLVSAFTRVGPSGVAVGGSVHEK